MSENKKQGRARHVRTFFLVLLLGVSACAPIPKIEESDLKAVRLSEDFKDPPLVEESCSCCDLRFSNAPLFRVASSSLFKDKVCLLKRKQRRSQADCRSDFVNPGDVVLAGPADRGFQCVYASTERGTLVTGFVPKENLEELKEEETSLSADFLLGTWRNLDSEITFFKDREGRLMASGDASWHGGQNSKGGEIEHFGGVRGPARLAGSNVIVDDGECNVLMRGRGPYLVANDNRRCGGANVRFAGIFAKVRRK